ncbi:MAG: glycine--tRNA ligase subunit beta [Actinobacteria bacterium]|nr:glycine--tRNA ligase subunit beta [Actinomycetota bacterium]
MGKNLLFEIGTEELPSSCLIEGIRNIKTLLEEKLTGNRINFSKVISYGTPRRLVAFVKDLDQMQQTQEKIIMGPPKNIAFDSSGKPTGAAVGFVKSLNVGIEDLQPVETPRGIYLTVKVVEEGRQTEKLLPEILKDVITSMTFNKQMTWGDYSIRFARPIRWIAAIYGKETINFSIENLASSNKTFGHRTLNGKPTIIRSTDLNSYIELLQGLNVVIDTEKRRQLILTGIKKLEESQWKNNFKAVLDEGLLGEVVNLAEIPNVLVGNFPREFLYIPREILIKAIQHHQRYFATVDKAGNVTTRFIVIQNGISDKKGEIIRGNERVLRARLSDARFFYEEDKKTSFETWHEKLKGVIFYSRLGTLYEKSKRLENICISIAEILNSRGILKKESVSVDLIRASMLCKCDLVANLVIEFPELQGLVGSEYAKEKGENTDVASAIFEHYLPRVAGDILPDTDTGAILSIADKIDTIAGMFLAGNLPSGSEDPFALRRKASGIILTALKKGYDIDLLKLSAFSIDLYLEKFNFSNVDRTKIINDVVEFVTARYKFQLEKQNKRIDILDAILGANCFSIIDMDLRYRAIENYLSAENIEKLSAPMIRCKNIIKGRRFSEIRPGLLSDEFEKELFSQITNKSNIIRRHMVEGKYSEALAELTEFGNSINIFFDKVLVMDNDETIRTNRINLVKESSSLYLLFADFSKIV